MTTAAASATNTPVWSSGPKGPKTRRQVHERAVRTAGPREPLSLGRFQEATAAPRGRCCVVSRRPSRRLADAPASARGNHRAASRPRVHSRGDPHTNAKVRRPPGGARRIPCDSAGRSAATRRQVARVLVRRRRARELPLGAAFPAGSTPPPLLLWLPCFGRSALAARLSPLGFRHSALCALLGPRYSARFAAIFWRNSSLVCVSCRRPISRSIASIGRTLLSTRRSK